MPRVSLFGLLMAWGVFNCADSHFFNFPRIVRTQEGYVSGRTARSAAGKTYTAFKGIPYAKPPVRFQPPQSHPAWRGIQDASSFGCECLQLNRSTGEMIGDENCLFVNVYSREVSPWKKAPGGLPVMVYVHGGLYIRGSGNDRLYGPHYLMDEEIVLVTFNYRLGVFGFMTTYDSAAPGNYGMLDQVLLLQWVQRNIASFGGDPRSVTIFGQSSGASCVSLLVLSPLTKGLFHHAISQSGTSLSNFGASGRRMAFTERLAERLSCPTNDSEAIVACLKEMPAELLLRNSTTDEHRYQPRVDTERTAPLLTDDPRRLLVSGNFNLVPWMQGVTKEEGWFLVLLFFADPRILAAVKAGNVAAWGRLADILTESASRIVDCGADPINETQKVLRFYSEEPGLGISSLLPLAQVSGDRFFNVPMLEETSLASRHTPVYRYVFEYKGPGRLFWENIRALGVNDTDPSHGDELTYLFSQTALPLEKPGTPNYDMIRSMVSLWTSFARTGRPTAPSPDAPDWPIVTEHSQRHMRLDSNLSLGERPFEDRFQFWKTVAINEPWRHPTQQSCPAVESNANASESGKRM